ncbi:MAG: DUF11 domain-containing protein [Acidobacteria bacterium]|nr:DUF11 domain-containing protein [Acidobacteriota bacterium]
MHKRWRLRLVVVSTLLIGLSFGVVFWVSAHNVAQVQTTVFFAPETVQLLQTRASGGSPGLRAGDVVGYIIQFSPVANNATIGAGGYVTAYIPAGTEVVGAEIVQPNGSGGYSSTAPDLPGPISNGWGPRGQRTFTGPFSGNYDARCATAGQPLGRCNGSLAEIYADTGIFYSTDARTAVYTSPDADGKARQGTNGYNISPTGESQLNPIIGQAGATTHNLWDADQANAFGSTSAAISSTANPKSAAASLSSGTGATPFNAGSAVAGPDSGYTLDNTGNIGPWRRISYFGSRIGTPNGPAVSTTRSYPESAGGPTDSSTYIAGSYTSFGWSLSEASPLPSNTNAVRWAVGQLVVGQTKYVKLRLRLTVNPPVNGLVLNSEVYGGDSAEAAGKAGNDNSWRYHVPSVANNNSNLYVLKQIVQVNGVASNGANIPANAKIRYRITYLNSGVTTQTNVLLTDTLPSQTAAGSVSNLSVISGANILPISPASPTAGGTFTFQMIASLGAGSGGAVEFDVQTNAGNGDTVINQALLTSSQVPTGVTSNAASVVSSTANLQITKSVTPSAIAVGGTVTYTITVTNTGNAAASSLVVYDFLPTAGGALNANTRFNFVTGSSVFTNITSVTPTVTAPPTQLPYTSDNRQEVKWDFATIPSPPTLAAGATFTIQFQATAGSGVPVSTTPYTNDAKVDYNNGSTSLASNITAAAPVLVSTPNVSLTKNVSPIGEQAPGTDLTYTIVFTNSGGLAAQRLSLTDPIPANTDFKVGSVFTSLGSTGLTITVEYSSDYNSAAPGAATWSYTPISGGGTAAAGYDRTVRAIRWRVTAGNLSPTVPDHTGNVGFTVQIR